MENQQQFEFMTEKVKERPLNKKKLIRQMLITISMALIFGLIACLTFSFLEPVLSNWLHPEEEIEKIEIPIVSEEILPEDMMVHEEVVLEPSQEVIDTLKNEIQLGTKDYLQLYQSIYNLVQSLQNVQVTVTGVTQEVDLFQTSYETKGNSIGYIFAQNSAEIMIMVRKDFVLENESLKVTFADNRKADAIIRGTDANTGLAVLAVKKSEMEENTLNSIGFLNMGSSTLSSLIASPVIAMGNPLGNESVVYGMITSIDTTVSVSDGHYKLLTTDIYGSTDAWGILIDLEGKLLGIINQNHNNEEAPNLISALGISDVRVALQRMSNGGKNSYLGIKGTDVPAEVSRVKKIPAGVYVTGIDLDSAAMQAGIQSGDIIVSMGKNEITSFADYVKVLNTWNPGESQTISLMRQSQGEYKTAKVAVVVGSRE